MNIRTEVVTRVKVPFWSGSRLCENFHIIFASGDPQNQPKTVKNRVTSIKTGFNPGTFNTRSHPTHFCTSQTLDTGLLTLTECRRARIHDWKWVLCRVIICDLAWSSLDYVKFLHNLGSIPASNNQKSCPKINIWSRREILITKSRFLLTSTSIQHTINTYWIIPSVAQHDLMILIRQVLKSKFEAAHDLG